MSCQRCNLIISHGKQCKRYSSCRRGCTSRCWQHINNYSRFIGCRDMMYKPVHLDPQLTQNEYRTCLKVLRTKNWVNDIFINGISHIFGMKSSKLKNFAILNSFTIDISQRSSRKLKIPIYDITRPIYDLFVFQNKDGNHWNLWHYDAKRNTFKIYDSMKDSFATYTDFSDRFIRYIRTIFPLLEHKPVKMIFPKVPQQLDAYNCGIYSLLFLRDILNHGRIKLKVEDSDDVRMLLKSNLPSRLHEP